MRRGPGVSKRPTCDGTDYALRDWVAVVFPAHFDIASCPAFPACPISARVRSGREVMDLDGDLQAIRYCSCAMLAVTGQNRLSCLPCQSHPRVPALTDASPCCPSCILV